MDNVLEIKDIAPPVEKLPELPLMLWLTMGLVVLCVVIVALLIIRGLKNNRKPSIDILSAPKLSNAGLALNKLDELMKKKLIEAGRTKLFYTELCLIFGRFIEDEFSVHASRKTTVELIAAILEANIVQAPDMASIRSLLRECDVFKFACIVAAPSTAQLSLQRCRDVIINLAGGNL